MISHPLGKTWHEGLKAEDHQMVPHSLPDEATLQQLAWDLPLRMRSFCRRQRSLHGPSTGRIFPFCAQAVPVHTPAVQPGTKNLPLQVKGIGMQLTDC